MTLISFFNLINFDLASNLCMSFDNLVNFDLVSSSCMGGSNIRCSCKLKEAHKDVDFVAQSH